MSTSDLEERYFPSTKDSFCPGACLPLVLRHFLVGCGGTVFVRGILFESAISKNLYRGNGKLFDTRAGSDRPKRGVRVSSIGAVWKNIDKREAGNESDQKLVQTFLR